MSHTDRGRCRGTNLCKSWNTHSCSPGPAGDDYKPYPSSWKEIRSILSGFERLDVPVGYPSQNIKFGVSGRPPITALASRKPAPRQPRRTVHLAMHCAPRTS